MTVPLINQVRTVGEAHRKDEYIFLELKGRGESAVMEGVYAQRGTPMRQVPLDSLGCLQGKGHPRNKRPTVFEHLVSESQYLTCIGECRRCYPHP
jgi:hypothetical protein